MQPITLTPIGVVEGGRSEPVDDHWGDVESTIVLDGTRFGPEVVAGLHDFSHLDVVFFFHLVHEDGVNLGARRPRGRDDWPLVGIFAQRAKARPNRLGISTCELLAVEGLRLRVQGLDAVDGTPVLDIKPCVREFGPRSQVRQPVWMTELMTEYW